MWKIFSKYPEIYFQTSWIYFLNSIKDCSQKSGIDFWNISEILIKSFETGDEHILAQYFSNILRNVYKTKNMSNSLLHYVEYLQNLLELRWNIINKCFDVTLFSISCDTLVKIKYPSNRGYMTLSCTLDFRKKRVIWQKASKAGYVTKPKSGLGIKELEKKRGTWQPQRLLKRHFVMYPTFFFLKEWGTWQKASKAGYMTAVIYQ